MKRIVFLLGMLALLVALPSNKVSAQINVNINIGQQPAWGPVGYDYVRYYYFPEINIYFDVPSSLFYYPRRGRWVAARYLPPAYARYDLYRTYKVVVNAANPWKYNRRHKKEYARYKHVHNQIIIRDCHDQRYHRSRNNHIHWVEDHHHHARPQKPARPPRQPHYKEHDRKHSDRDYKKDKYNKRNDKKRNDKKQYEKRRKTRERHDDD